MPWMLHRDMASLDEASPVLTKVLMKAALSGNQVKRNVVTNRGMV